jgi:hypothetical protein
MILEIPALKVASTARIAVEDAVPAPVNEAKPPIPAAKAGAANPPVTANTVPSLDSSQCLSHDTNTGKTKQYDADINTYVSPTPAIFKLLNICFFLCEVQYSDGSSTL